MVEVIVVLVILAILAAIAIPALTGYIDKAEDKKYIALARQYYTATRAVMSEAYGAGEISSSPPAIDYIEKASTSRKYSNYWPSQKIVPDYWERADALIGQESPASKTAGEWAMDFIGEKGNSTFWDADGFCFVYYPEGQNIGKEAVQVTYKVENVSTGAITNNKEWADVYFDMKYDPDAGYIVYRFAYSW